jgi:hypothetical protein
MGLFSSGYNGPALKTIWFNLVSKKNGLGVGGSGSNGSNSKGDFFLASKWASRLWTAQAQKKSRASVGLILAAKLQSCV